MGISRRRLGSYFCLIVLLLVGFSQSAYAKSTANPNHQGWSGSYPKLKQVEWKTVKHKCAQCDEMLGQYNDTMAQLLKSRYWIKFWQEAAQSQKPGKANPFWPEHSSIEDFAAKSVSANLQIKQLQEEQLELHQSLVNSLEQHARYLRQAIQQCEQNACAKSKKSKLKALKSNPNTSTQLDQASVLKTLQVDWSGPYTTSCLPCQPIVAQLNALPDWIMRTHRQIQIAEQQLRYASLIKQSNSIKIEHLHYAHPDKSDFSQLDESLSQLRDDLAAQKQYFDQLLKKLGRCEKQYCVEDSVSSTAQESPQLSTPIITSVNNCPLPDSASPVTVGPNNEVGSSANFKEKAKNKALGAAGKVIGGLLGVGGGSKAKSDGPATYKDPVKSKHKIRIINKPAKRELRSGAVFTPNGLLVSTSIKKAPGKGTFQSIHMENQRGWPLTPIAVYMYEIWRDWKLSVSWTRDTYVDGQLVKHEQGGWTESWRELIAQGDETIYAQVNSQPLWEQLGFNTAVSGARSIGTLFAITPQMLANEPVDLVIHVTDPKQDPVTTVPYIIRVSLGEDGKPVLSETEQTLTAQNNPCTEDTATAIASQSNTAQNQPDNAAPIARQTTQDSADNNPANAQNAPQDTTAKQSADDSIDTGDSQETEPKERKPDPTREVDPEALAAITSKDPCQETCKQLRLIAEEKAATAKSRQQAADQAKTSADSAEKSAQQAEAQANRAEQLAKDTPRDDHAIINDDKYTTADTEYRVKLQAEINAKHKAGEISNAEHERQTKANTVKKAREERLKRLAELKQQAEQARAQANAARAAAEKAKAYADKAQIAADDAAAAAKAARKAYDDCREKAKQECEQKKAAEAKRIAEQQAAEAKRKAEQERIRQQQIADEKRKAAEQERQRLIKAENKRLLALIKKLGLIDTKIGDVPSLWQWLPDILETPVGMLAEQQAGIPIPTDTIKALGGLYGIVGSMLNPCTKAGIEKTQQRLRSMINEKTGKRYTEAEAAKETSDMCRLLGDLRGRITGIQNAQK